MRKVCHALATICVTIATSGAAQTDTASVPVAAAAAPPDVPEIRLICEGTGTFPESHQASAFVFDNQGGSAIATGTEISRGYAEGEALIDIVGNTGRVKLPASVVPTLRVKTDNGWRPFDSLTIDDSHINGRITYNFLDKPTVNIDRISGHVEIKGINKRSFVGECRPYDAATERKF